MIFAHTHTIVNLFLRHYCGKGVLSKSKAAAVPQRDNFAKTLQEISGS